MDPSELVFASAGLIVPYVAKAPVAAIPRDRSALVLCTPVLCCWFQLGACLPTCFQLVPSPMPKTCMGPRPLWRCLRPRRTRHLLLPQVPEASAGDVPPLGSPAELEKVARLWDANDLLMLCTDERPYEGIRLRPLTAK